MLIPIIGMDFGDTKTDMAFLNEYDPEKRLSGITHELLPTKFIDGIPNVYFYSGELGQSLCGKDAVTSKAKPEQNTLRNLRRHLGEEIQIDDRNISYDSAITEMIQHCIRIANEQFESRWLVSTNLVSLSYPSEYSLKQKQHLIELVEKATLEDGRNVKVVGTITDSAAAALNYLIEYANKDTDITVLTYDLGGETFGLELVSMYPKGRKGRDGNTYYYDVININGIPNLGGAEFDEVMFRLVLSKIDVSMDDRRKAILKNSCEIAKVELSDRTDTEIGIFFDNEFLSVLITREEYEKAVMPLVQKTIDKTSQMLDEHMNQKPDVILLIGGASQMPIIQREMEKAFPDFSGKINMYKPSRSVACGAARYGGYIYGRYKNEDSTIVQETYSSLRIINNLGDIHQIEFNGLVPYESSVIMFSGDRICLQEYDRDFKKWKNNIICSINLPMMVKLNISINGNGVLDIKINDFKKNEWIQTIST